MAVAVFNYATWLILYPQFAGKIDEPTATALFGQAGLYLDNTDGSIVCDVNARLAILNMITAHLAAMTAAGGGSGTVGHLSWAAEGSVSARFDYKSTTASAWWDQTPFGAAAWQALLPYRMGRYVPGPQSPPWPIYGGFRRGYGNWPSV